MRGKEKWDERAETGGGAKQKFHRVVKNDGHDCKCMQATIGRTRQNEEQFAFPAACSMHRREEFMPTNRLLGHYFGHEMC